MFFLCFTAESPHDKSWTTNGSKVDSEVSFNSHTIWLVTCWKSVSSFSISSQAFQKVQEKAWSFFGCLWDSQIHYSSGRPWGLHFRSSYERPDPFQVWWPSNFISWGWSTLGYGSRISLLVFKHIQFSYTCFDCNQFCRDWILTSRQFPLMLFAMTRGRIISSGWSGSFGTILLVDSSTPTEETCATQNSWQSGTKFLLLQPRTSEGARKCLSITKFADGPNLWNVLCSEPQNSSRPDTHNLLVCSDDVFISCR